MAVALSGQNIVVSGAGAIHTWADLVALGSTLMTTHTITDGRAIYRWQGVITVQDTATLNILSEIIELFRDQTSGDRLGQIKTTGSAIVNFDNCNITVTSHDTNFNESTRRMLRNESTTAQINAYETNFFIGFAPTLVNEGGSSRVEINLNTITNCIVTGNTKSPAREGFFLLKRSGVITNLILNRTALTLFEDVAVSISNLQILSGGNSAFVNWDYTGGTVRDVAITGTATYDYYSPTTIYNTFVDCVIDLSKGRIMKFASTLASNEHKRAASHNLRIVDASGNINNALVTYTGRTTASATSNASGVVSEFILVFQETNLQAQPDPGGDWAEYPTPLQVIDYSAYTRAIKSYRHLSRSESLVIDSRLGSASVLLETPLTIDEGVTETNTTTVSGYSGITNATGSITLSGTLTLNQVYDSRKLYWRNNSGISVPTKNGTEANFGSANITINAPSNLPATTAKYTEFSTTGTITLGAIGNYSATPFIAGSSSVITVTPGGVTDLRIWTIPSGATINRSSTGSATVYVASTTGITAGIGVTLQLAPSVITIAGFQPLSDVIISQAGRTLDRLNDTSPPFTWNATGISIPSSVGLTITKEGFEIYTQTIQVTQANQSITVAQIPAGATDTFNGAEFKFKSLMIADAGFKRILAAATGALVDDAANCRLAQFESASVKTSWNLLVAATVPTAPEITAWQGYLVSAGYSAISFSNVSGEVS